jgi:hypothetical protein
MTAYGADWEAGVDQINNGRLAGRFICVQPAVLRCVGSGSRSKDSHPLHVMDGSKELLSKTQGVKQLD